MILHLVDKFNDTIWYNTVQYGTVQYGTNVTWFTCGFSHLTMRFVLAAGPSRMVMYRNENREILERREAAPI